MQDDLPSWYVDRTRYQQGHVCSWRRLLGFHAFSRGLSPITPSRPLTTGILVHKSLELLLGIPAVLSNGAATLLDVNQAVSDAVQVWESDPNHASLSLPPDIYDLTSALSHGYARVTLPTVLSQFDIVSVETEYILALDHPDIPITWMARPDLVCRDKSTGVLSIHDFKTAAYWSDSSLPEWSDSLQLMMNAHVVSQAMGQPIPHYYVHILVKGTESYPSPLTHAWYRPPSPPFEPEDWQLKKPYGRKVGLPYTRIPVSTHRPLAPWVWSLPSATISKSFILAGPFPVSPYKVSLFIQGLFANEHWWKESLISLIDATSGDSHDPALLQTPKVRTAMSTLFPRTFNCYTYNSRCPYYSLCLQPETNWPDHYVLRTPHHTTEILDEG